MGHIVREGSEGLTGGEVTSNPPHAIQADEASLAENIDPRSTKGATTRNGRTQFGVANGSNTGVKGLKAWTRNSATSFLVARTGTTFYNVSALAWASIGIGGTNNSYFTAAPLNNVLCIVVDGLAPKSWDGTTFTSLTGSPPSAAQYADVYSSKLFLAGDTANPQRLSFSATNNPNDWTATNDAGSITSQLGGGDTIQGISAARKWLCVYYRYYTEILIGNSVFNFSVERLCDRGLCSRLGHASAGDVNFFCSDDAIYMVAGARAADITTGRMKSAYQDLTDKTQLTMSVKGDLLLVVDNNTNRAFACYYKKLIWAEWTGQTWEVMDTSNDQILYAGTNNGSTTQIWKLDTGSLDGTATITCKWKTPDFGFGAPDVVKNLAAARVLAKPGLGTVTITYYKNGVSTGSTTDVTFAASGNEDWAGRSGQRAIRGQYLGVQFQWTGAGTLYGYALYAEVTADKGQIPAEI